MAKRPIFLIEDYLSKKSFKEGELDFGENNDKNFIKVEDIEFEWFSGFSKKQKEKSINSLHEKSAEQLEIRKEKILEISTKSDKETGKNASAFNLELKFKNFKCSVEWFYQKSKVFINKEKDNGTPYQGYKNRYSSYEAKKQAKELHKEYEFQGFKFFDEEWDKDDGFYEYLYIMALNQNEKILNELMKYEVFTDIEFNPKRLYNCQAGVVALCISAKKRKIDLKEVKTKKGLYEKIPHEKLLISNLISNYKKRN